ncbi:undecaprenyl-phosphate glucose phosphotransferase [Pseudomonas nicosulfuronedens]
MPNKTKGILRAHQSLISLAHRLSDILVIVLTGVVLLSAGSGVLDAQLWVSVLLCVMLFHWLGELNQLYGSWRGESLLRESLSVTLYWSLAFFAVLLLDISLRHVELEEPRRLGWFAVALLIMGGYRLAIRMLLRVARRHGFNSCNVAIYGTGEVGARLAETILAAPWMGLRLIGFYDDRPQQMELGERVPVKGDRLALIEAARSGQIDKVYLTLPLSREPLLNELIRELSDTTVSVYLIPDLFMFDLLHARSESINGLATISIFDTPMDGPNAVLKRIEDVVLASLILLLIAVPMLLIAVAVKLTSRGPVLFRQTRYGMDGRPIRVWKFRSMTVMEDGAAVIQASRNDCRITPLGAFLRRTSLDELPQFFNVLLGDMSVVGPRPHAVAHNEQYRRQVSRYMLRHKVKPGITGWAQVNGWRGETDTLEKMQKRIEFDLDYIENWSVWWDLKIVLLTLFKGFVHRNAY